MFANHLANMYAQYDRVELDIEDDLNYCEIVSIKLADLKSVHFSKLTTDKYCDEHGLVVELLQPANDEFLILLFDYYNDILFRRVIDEEWLVVVFKIMPKLCDLQNPSNWRPIVILLFIYKVFLKIIANRIYQLLHNEQSDDLFNLKLSKRIEHIFCIFKDLINKSTEWSLLL